MDCYFHHAVPSVARCTECGKPVCATCRAEGAATARVAAWPRGSTPRRPSASPCGETSGRRAASGGKLRDRRHRRGAIAARRAARVARAGCAGLSVLAARAAGAFRPLALDLRAAQCLAGTGLQRRDVRRRQAVHVDRGVSRSSASRPGRCCRSSSRSRSWPVSFTRSKSGTARTCTCPSSPNWSTSACTPRAARLQPIASWRVTSAR